MLYRQHFLTKNLFNRKKNCLTKVISALRPSICLVSCKGVKMMPRVSLAENLSSWLPLVTAGFWWLT